MYFFYCSIHLSIRIYFWFFNPSFSFSLSLSPGAGGGNHILLSIFQISVNIFFYFSIHLSIYNWYFFIRLSLFLLLSLSSYHSLSVSRGGAVKQILIAIYFAIHLSIYIYLLAASPLVSSGFAAIRCFRALPYAWWYLYYEELFEIDCKKITNLEF